MKSGFTLLELIVVIVILGIMATLAASQYSRMVEKSRGAEARTALGRVRTMQAALKLQNGVCSAVDADVGVGGSGYDLPSSCTATHYFSYDITGASNNSFTAVATRCTSGGKTPTYSAAGTVTLTTNFDNGYDNWAMGASGPY